MRQIDSDTFSFTPLIMRFTFLIAMPLRSFDFIFQGRDASDQHIIDVVLKMLQGE